ncbi:hypothetical protein KCU65_g441, partial [Aureobasidium melanogenum]
MSPDERGQWKQNAVEAELTYIRTDFRIGRHEQKFRHTVLQHHGRLCRPDGNLGAHVTPGLREQQTDSVVPLDNGRPSLVGREDAIVANRGSDSIKHILLVNRELNRVTLLLALDVLLQGSHSSLPGSISVLENVKLILQASDFVLQVLDSLLQLLVLLLGLGELSLHPLTSLSTHLNPVLDVLELHIMTVNADLTLLSKFLSPHALSIESGKLSVDVLDSLQQAKFTILVDITLLTEVFGSVCFVEGMRWFGRWTRGTIESGVLSDSGRVVKAHTISRGSRSDATGLLVAKECGKVVASSHCVGVGAAVLSSVSSVGMSRWLSESMEVPCSMPIGVVLSCVRRFAGVQCVFERSSGSLVSVTSLWGASRSDSVFLAVSHRVGVGGVVVEWKQSGSELGEDFECEEFTCLTTMATERPSDRTSPWTYQKARHICAFRRYESLFWYYKMHFYIERHANK